MPGGDAVVAYPPAYAVLERKDILGATGMEDSVHVVRGAKNELSVLSSRRKFGDLGWLISGTEARRARRSAEGWESRWEARCMPSRGK